MPARRGRRWIPWVLTAGVIGCQAAARPEGATPSIPAISRFPTVAPAPSPSPTATRSETGAGLFAAFCESCHPQGGHAPGAGPSLRGVVHRHSAGFIRQQIRNGRGDMPGFGDRLSEEEIERLLGYLRTLEGEPTFARTPVPPDPGAVARGRALFRQRCASCHLEGGRLPGTGLGFEPPAPVLVDEIRHHTPAFIARQIREGGGQMPAVGADLTEEEMADLIAYLSALAIGSEGP